MIGKFHTSAHVGLEVEIGEHVEIGAGAVIHGRVVIEDDVKISAGVIIGMDAEHLERGTDDDSKIVICKGTRIREHAVIQRGVLGGRGTWVGRNCYLMSGCHVAHDCVLEDGVIMSSQAVLGGQTTVMEGANMGIGSATHQFVTLGPYCMVGMGAMVIDDVPPWRKVVGAPARDIGLNEVGLRRAKLSQERSCLLQTAFLRIQKRRLVKPR